MVHFYCPKGVLRYLRSPWCAIISKQFFALSGLYIWWYPSTTSRIEILSAPKRPCITISTRGIAQISGILQSLKALNSQRILCLLPWSCIITGDTTAPHGVSSTGSKTPKSQSSCRFVAMSLLCCGKAGYSIFCRKGECSPSFVSQMDGKLHSCDIPQLTLSMGKDHRILSAHIFNSLPIIS